MSNTYNAKLSFKGEGNFSFTLPGYGELTIYSGKDIYVKGLTVNGVEALRQLRPLLLDHQLNAKPDGCYKVLDLTNYTNKPVQTFERAYKEPVKSVADLKAELIKSNGPIVEDEPIKEEIKEIVKEEVKEELNKEKAEETKEEVKPTTKKKNNKKGKSKKTK